jgi:Zn-dependent protease
VTLGLLFLEWLTRDPVYFFSVVFAVVLSVVLHELGHGVAAIWQGDDTPRVTGHMTWDPMVHMGGFSLILLVVAGIAFGAMPVNPSRFRGRFGRALVALAGPAVNLILAFLALTILAAWVVTIGPAEGAVAANFQRFFFILGFLNLVLFAFNLLPIPPLDGSSILADVNSGYRRFISNPNNQPFLMGGFILVFFFAGDLFLVARHVADAYLGLWGVGWG